MFDEKLAEHEIRKCIRYTHPKASGLDKVNSRTLKAALGQDARSQ